MSKTVIPQQLKTAKKVDGAPSMRFSREEQMEYARAARDIQANIDDYNNSVLIEPVDPAFSGFTFTNDTIIVKLYRENFVKSEVNISMVVDDEGTIEQVLQPIAGYSQIDGRQRESDVEQYVDTPLPYIMKGKLCAISPSARKFFEEQGVNINVGDIVTLDEVILRNARFYLSQQDAKIDHIANQRERSLYKHEGYFKFHKYDIQSVVTNHQYRHSY